MSERITLTLSGSRKVSPLSRYRESEHYTGWDAIIFNSSGLLAGESCPGETEYCGRVCYAKDLERWRTSTKAAMARNLRILEEAGSVESMKNLLVDMVGRTERQFNSYNIPVDDRVFRIHWDGDFFSQDYAQAMADTVSEFPDIKFWVYTRSFQPEMNVVPILYGIDNLALYLSVDEDNFEIANALLDDYPDILLAPLDDDFDLARQLVDTTKTEKRLFNCPENARTLPLVGEDGRGACVSCRYCIDGKGHVVFSRTGEKVDDPNLKFRFPIELV